MRWGVIVPQRIRWTVELMQELELHSRQRLGTSHQDGILVWSHFDRDRGGRRGRGNRLGAPLLLLIAASLEAIRGQKAETTKREEWAPVGGGATCPTLGRAEMVEQKGRVLPRWRHEEQRECDTDLSMRRGVHTRTQGEERPRPGPALRRRGRGTEAARGQGRGKLSVRLAWLAWLVS